MTIQIQISNGVRKTFLLLTVFSLLSMLALPLPSLAIGQVTEPIVITNALRGQHYQSELTIINTDKKEMNIGLSAEGQIAGWTKFYQRTDFENATSTVKAAAGATLNMVADFSVPTSTANGTYQGVVSVTTKPEQSSSKDQSYSTVAQKIDREVSITVTDKENINLEVSVIPNKYDFAKNEPLKVRFIYDNQSNIELKPQIQLKITQPDKTFYNAIFPYPEDETAVVPLSQHEIPALEIPTSGLANGKYVAETSFLHNGNVITEKQFTFSVGLQNTLFATKIIDFFKGNLTWLLGILAVILLAAAALLVKKNLDLKKGAVKKFKILKKTLGKNFKIVWNGIVGIF